MPDKTFQNFPEILEILQNPFLVYLVELLIFIIK